MRTYDRLADLSVTIERYRLDGLKLSVSGGFERNTTLVRLEGRDEEGLGEDVTYDTADQLAFQRDGRELPLGGEFSLSGFSARLEELELFSKTPSQEVSRNYRRWALESAALDLALRQAGCSLSERLGIEPTPARFVISMGLGHPPSLDRVGQWLSLYPDLELKLDASSAWSDGLLQRLAETGAVRVIDFKGANKGTPVDQPPDAGLYARVARALPDAWLEDPAWTPETLRALDPYRDRVTWDVPICSIEDIGDLQFPPRMLNFKPSRFGSVQALFDGYDYCRVKKIRLYGGGQFELGVGRGQIQYLAALFHHDGPNDVAPTGFHTTVAVPGLPQSPLPPALPPTGFRRANV